MTALSKSILDENEGFKRYYELAQSDPTAALALSAQKADQVATQLVDHIEKPFPLAHAPVKGTDMSDDKINFSGSVKAGKIVDYLKWLIITIALIATGGLTTTYVLPALTGG